MEYWKNACPLKRNRLNIFRKSKLYSYILFLSVFLISLFPLISFSQAVNPLLQQEMDELTRLAESAAKAKKQFKKFPQLSDVRFSVQIVEVDSPLKLDYFNNIPEDIMFDKMPNGKWTYLSGIFKYYDAASAYRRDMLEIGYRKAILIAYKDGNRIKIDEAIEADEKSMVPEKHETPPSEIVHISEKETATNTVFATISKPEKKAEVKRDIEFRIQIAASKIQIPLTSPTLNKFPNVFSQKDDDGLYRYFTGSYKTFEAAINARKKIMEQGAKEAFVVAYSNKNKISLAEAQKLLKEK